MEEIESETQFIWKLILHTILTPITIILVLFKRREPKDIFQPITDIFKFIFEPRFTIGIIILTILVSFAAWTFLTESQFLNLAIYPSDIFHPSRYFSIITSGFLHLNMLHLFSNMIALFIFGRATERRLGFIKTAFVYFGAMVISNVGASSMNYFTGVDVPAIGASGAIFGLIGAAVLLDPFYLTYELVIPLPIMVVGWIAIYGAISGLLFPTGDGIGHLAHLLGLKSISTILFICPGFSVTTIQSSVPGSSIFRTLTKAVNRSLVDIIPLRYPSSSITGNAPTFFF